MTRNSSPQPPNSDRIIVIGAGIAGLAAARTLAEAGRSVLLIEGSSRVGGRIFSQPLAGLREPVELGAEFIHGQPADLLSLVAEAGLTVYELEGQSYRSGAKGLEPAADDGDWYAPLAKLPTEGSRDQSFADFLSEPGLKPETGERLISYVEGFNAADARLISSQALRVQQEAEDAIDGERVFHILEGYSSLAAYLLQCFQRAGGTLMLNAPVTSIYWSMGAVEIVVSAPRQLSTGQPEVLRSVIHGSRLIVAVPLGVLQAGMLSIEPLPSNWGALQDVVMGTVHRISLVFRFRFWEDTTSTAGMQAPDLGFLFSDKGDFRVWWTSHPSPVPILTGWIGGSRTHQIEAGDLLAAALKALTGIFGRSDEELKSLLVSSYHHDWNADPWTLGAYSYVRVGGLTASAALSRPVDQTLFFAGEHTDLSGHWGTVHGALRSGMRAARQILEATK